MSRRYRSEFSTAALMVVLNRQCLVHGAAVGTGVVARELGVDSSLVSARLNKLWSEGRIDRELVSESPKRFAWRAPS